MPRPAQISGSRPKRSVHRNCLSHRTSPAHLNGHVNRPAARIAERTCATRRTRDTRHCGKSPTACWPEHAQEAEVVLANKLWEENTMDIDTNARWLSRVTLAVAIIMIGWGLGVVFGQPVTAWFATSATIWMALLLISPLWQFRASFTAISALALATPVVSLLFSLLPLNPPATLA